jgi:hydrogenase expression/formation protein HypC
MCLGIPGQIVEVREEYGVRFAKVRFAGVVRDACLVCQPDAVLGDHVLVHVGFVIARINEEEAARAYKVLEELGQTAELTSDLPCQETGTSR